MKMFGFKSPGCIACARRWRCWLLMLFGSSALQAGVAVADPLDHKISQVKAAFVYNIAKFVSWPETVLPATPQVLSLCYYREDFIGRGFEAIGEKRIQARALDKRVINNLEEQSACHILLIASGQLTRFGDEAQGAPARPVLTIADLTETTAPSELTPGVAVNLVRQRSSIGFEVNLAQVTERGLAMSSELLKLARIVGTERTP